MKVAHPMIPRNAARVVARGTIHSIALFVSARDSAEIRAHATPYFLLIFEQHFAGLDFAQWIDHLIGELVRSGAASREGLMIRNAG